MVNDLNDNFSSLFFPSFLYLICSIIPIFSPIINLKLLGLRSAPSPNTVMASIYSRSIRIRKQITIILSIQHKQPTGI